MNKKTAKVMAAFIIGQIVQVICHVLAKVAYMNRPVLFCIAAGFLITVAVIAGITLADSEKQPTHQKTYAEWAEQEDLHGED